MYSVQLLLQDALPVVERLNRVKEDALFLLFAQQDLLACGLIHSAVLIAANLQEEHAQ
jgi:hypothetical protein